MDEAIAKNWRKRLSLMRTIGVLRQDSPDESRLGEAIARAGGGALAAAAANPDHSEAARSAALNALRARGEDQVWRFAAPGFVTGKDLARGRTVFFGLGAFVRGFVLMAAIACLAAAITALFAARNLAGPSLAVGAAALIAWAGLSLLRLKPARIVVLRASDTTLHRRAFRAFVGTELAGFGHVWRWAGPDGKEAPERTISSAADYRKLAYALRHLIGLNWESATGAVRRVKPVAAAASWRALTQSLLLDSADAVVVDVTGAESWALEAALNRPCVFVALWGQLEAAQAALMRAGIGAECYAYAPDGHAVQRAKFRAAMIAAMRAKHEAAV